MVSYINYSLILSYFFVRLSKRREIEKTLKSPKHPRVGDFNTRADLSGAWRELCFGM